MQNQVIKTSEKTNWKTMLGEKPSFLKSQATARCCVAIDCEMVLTKTKSGDEVDALARVAIVDENNTVLMDEYCRPSDFIIDFKTDVSGIKPGHMKNGMLYLVYITLQQNLLHKFNPSSKNISKIVS